MEGEVVCTNENAFSEHERNLLFYAGIGTAAGIGCAVAYNVQTYRDVRTDFDDRTAQTANLEETASALQASGKHLEFKGLVDRATLEVMSTERTELIAEAQAIKKDTPNIVVEQLTWAGAGIIPGIALGIGAWASHRRWKKHRQLNTTT